MTAVPSVLFVCVHNAGRSQMAAGWLTHLAGDRVEVRSAGSAPRDAVNIIRRVAGRELCSRAVEGLAAMVDESPKQMVG